MMMILTIKALARMMLSIRNREAESDAGVYNEDDTGEAPTRMKNGRTLLMRNMRNIYRVSE